MAAKTGFDEPLMLLSSDWFLPYWAIFGLFLDASQKHTIQHAAQVSVQDFMRGTDVYWDISFDEQRERKTKKNFVDDLTRKGIQPETSTRLVNALTSAINNDSRDVATTIWLFQMICEMLREKDHGISAELLDFEILQKLRQELNSQKEAVAPIDFESVAFESETEWDKNLRAMTPDLPTFLSDFANSNLQTASEFKLLWCSLANKLSNHQRKSLVAWLIAESRKLADPGFEFELPTWMSS